MLSPIYYTVKQVFNFFNNLTCIEFNMGLVFIVTQGVNMSKDNRKHIRLRPKTAERFKHIAKIKKITHGELINYLINTEICHNER